ncbi:MAG: hypothetical protein IT373_24930 [Polyangiaceae bacterium]|nr:hypothetical protein [Polyangiaceae bacterium]
MVDLQELRAYARGRLGLIIGPGATTPDAQFWTNLTASLAEQFKVEARTTFHETAELAVHTGMPIDTVRRAIASHAATVPASPALSQLAVIRWTAIISCSLDDHLETRLEREHMRRPARPAVAILSTPDSLPRPGTLPIYKLLGSARRGDNVATTADTLRRTATLPAICREFADLVKASPVLCAGVDGVSWLLNPLLAALFGLRGGGPGKFIVLAHDPVASNPTILELVPPSVLTRAPASLLDVAKAVEPSQANRQTALAFTSATGKTETLDLSEFADLFALVNSHLEATIKSSERERLLDYLFMPDLPNWDAAAHGMDFPRTLTPQILDGLSCATSEDDVSITVVHGRAASGKTIVMKRLAFELARSGEPICWLKDYWYGDVSSRIERLLRRADQVKLAGRLTFVLDSSVGGRDEALRTLLRKAATVRTHLRIIIGTRTSMLAQLEQELRSNSAVASATWELPDGLDDDEWGRLPQYLVHLGVAPDEQAGRSAAVAASSKTARDTLAVLYWLLPQTRQVIAKSIQEEYATLGDSLSLNAVLSEALAATPGSLREAYAMVAVSTKYHAALPIEVLTRALEVKYAEWLDASGSGGPAWGLFYSAEDSDAEGAAYVTRNDIVTEVLLRAINGGVLSRSGEVAVLERLLRACDGTSPVYEQYCERILVPHKNLHGLSLSDGLSLYNAAAKALPSKSRSILHHKALWLRKHGGDIDESIAVLDEALEAAPSPHGDHVEADEHIHTSKAAAILEKMDQKRMSAEDGRQQALLELERSRSPRFINPHATHVYAGLVSKLAFGKAGVDRVDRFELLNRALSDLDRMIVLVRSGGVRRRGTQNDLLVLEARRDEILAKCVDTEEMADTLWSEQKSQVGFVVATRRRYSAAIGTADSGRIFKDAYSYWTRARDLVLASGAEITPELAEVGLMLYFAWQVYPRSRKRIRTAHSPVEWGMMKELARRTLLSPRFGRDPFYRFLEGMCLCQKSEWGAAELAFAENRRLGLPNDVLHAPRAYLLHPEGMPWKIQGHLKPGASVGYFDAPDLHHQFQVTKTEAWPKGSAVLHAFVVLSFAGPRATRTEDLCREVVG